MERIENYEIINHGVDRSDHFQGCGTSHTDFDDVATGIGYSEKEALDDALDTLAYSGWDVDSNPELLADCDNADDTDIITTIIEEYSDGDGDYENPWVHVSVRVR